MIFVFLDRTGNEFIADSDPKKANSNVVQLYTTLKVAGDQVAYYHPGVGTMVAQPFAGASLATGP